MITAKSLLAWGDIDERRRRAARSGLGALPAWVWALVIGLALAAEVAHRAGSFGGAADPVMASRFWLTIAVAIYSVVLFGTPFRLYWRRDSAFLARLPIPGDALFRLGAVRSMRAAVLATIPVVIGLAPLALVAPIEILARHFLVIALGALGAGLFGPAVCLAAGAIVASDKAQAIIDSFGGEFRAPKTSWLGMLPGLGATAVAVGMIAAWPWAVGDRPPGGSAVLIAAIGLAVPIASFAWAWLAAGRHMLAATREVAALDQERLAHVERSTPSALERAWTKLTLPSEAARLVAEKDQTLARRRFPSPYFLGPLGVIVLWILAAVGSEGSLSWSATILAALGGYAVIMARRSVSLPVEHSRFIRSLAVSRADVSAAKHRQHALRVVVWLIIGGAPLVALSSDIALTAILVGGIAAGSYIGGRVAVGHHDS